MMADQMQQQNASWYVCGRYPGKAAARKAKEQVWEAVRGTSGSALSVYRVWSIEDEAWYVVVVASGIPSYDIRQAITKAFRKTGGEERFLSPEAIGEVLEKHLEHFGKSISIVPGSMQQHPL